MRKFYTVEYKLKVLVRLDENNGNIYHTAKQFGLPRQTVNDWSRKRELIFAQSEEDAEKRRLPMSRRLALLINQIVDSLPDKVEQAKLGMLRAP
jgi:transposase-like protein